VTRPTFAEITFRNHCNQVSFLVYEFWIESKSVREISALLTSGVTGRVAQCGDFRERQHLAGGSGFNYFWNLPAGRQRSQGCAALPVTPPYVVPYNRVVLCNLYSFDLFFTFPLPKSELRFGKVPNSRSTSCVVDSNVCAQAPVCRDMSPLSRGLCGWRFGLSGLTSAATDSNTGEVR
jgi:hypothetical protein